MSLHNVAHPLQTHLIMSNNFQSKISQYGTLVYNRLCRRRISATFASVSARVLREDITLSIFPSSSSFTLLSKGLIMLLLSHMAKPIVDAVIAVKIPTIIHKNVII